LDFADDVLHLAGLGFKDISLEPVAGGVGDEFEIKGVDLDAACAEYERLAMEIINRMGTNERFNFFHFMIDLSGGPCAAKRLHGCGAGVEYLAAAADGSLYPCHQFAGIERFRMGSVYDNDMNDTKTLTIQQMFGDCNVSAKPVCRGCFAKFYCGCEMQKKRVECAIAIQAVLNS
jgi:uncharacterized protein